MLFETVEQWLDAMTNHSCSNKNFVASDDPLNRRIGYMCSNCTKDNHMENFEIDFKVVKTFSDLPNEKKDLLKLLLQSADGRIKLGKSLSLSKKKIDVREVLIFDTQLDDKFIKRGERIS